MLVTDSLSLTLLQVESLVSTLNKKNHKNNFAEANQLIEHLKPVSERYFTRCLFSSIDFSSNESKNVQRDFYQIQHLVQGFNELLSKPYFPTLFHYALDKPPPSTKGSDPLQHLLSQISRVLQLTRFQEVVFGLALTRSENVQIVFCAQQWIRQKIPELIKDHITETTGTPAIGSSNSDQTETTASCKPDVTHSSGRRSNSGVLQDASIELLHFLLGHILDDADHFGVSSEALHSLLSSFRRDFPKSRVPLVLSALLYPDIVELNPSRAFGQETNFTWLINAATAKMHSDNSLLLFSLEQQELRSITGPAKNEPVASGLVMPQLTPGPCSVALEDCVADPSLVSDLLEELGYACTWTLDSMRLTLAEFTQRELTPAAIAKCLCLFLRTADGQLQRSVSSDTVEEDTLMFLRVGGSGALWREATSDRTGHARPTSLVLSSFSDEVRPLTSFSSEPRLGDPGSTASQFSPIATGTGSPYWNVDHFITVIFELNPTISIHQVISELDCSEFLITSRASFMILKQFLLRGSQPQLPVDLFYRPWKYIHGQFSLLRACHAYPDVICLAYWPHRSVELSNYRLEEHTQMQIWKNVDYVQALLYLSERGLFSEVYQFLRKAFQLCPDILTATLFETSPTPIRSVMLGHALVYFLSPRTNSQAVLQTAWYGCKANDLTSADLQQQRLLLLAAIVESTAQLTAGISEPTTLPESVGAAPTVQNNLTRVIQLLVDVSDSVMISGSRGAPLLSVLLGSTEAASAAVSVLLPPAANVGQQSQSDTITVPSHLLPQPMQAIDLALVLLVRIANAVSLAASRAGAEVNSSLTSIQNAIRVFLLQWFTEIFRDKELAEPFAYGIVDYLRMRYGSHVLGTPNSSPSRPAALIPALPPELRKPSMALLTRIIQSAQAALKTPTCCIRKPALSELNQTLSLYLQNLSTGAPATAPSPAGAQIGRQFGSSTPSAFGLAMKSGAPPLGSGAAQSQAQQQGRQVVPPTGLHPYQQPDLATAGLFASNTDDAFSRSTALSSFTGRLNQTGLVQHGPLSRKPSEALAYPMDHSPVALSFANEPIKIEMSKEAEAEAYGFFQKLLKGISTPDEMFKTVCEYATQGSLSQRKLLDGILRMLADEVSQYLPDYPEPMLPLIADLYGSILAASTQLLSIRALSMLWRALLTRIHSLTPEATETPLFRAVILILLKAKHAYTQFFNLPSCLVTCPVFKYFPHELQEYLLSAEMLANNYVRSQQVAGSGGSKAAITTSGTAFHPAGQLLGQHQSSTGVAAVSQQPSSSSHLQQQQPIGLSMYATQPEPPFKPPDPPEESISDRIYFLFNNVSQANVKEKSAELVEILSEERLLPWFAFYLIGKRIPVEHTFHDLFAVVLDHVQEQITNLRQPIMHELLRNIKVLLRNMRKDRDDMQARMTLKNLGNFLGLITLARNKPLLHDDLNVKDLVYEAYHKGPVPAQYVVPFVARIVKNATNSIVFRPPNPWTMAILKVFRELYDLNDVKDCIRFEIELLYRNFSLNVEDVPMAHFLRDRGHAANLEVQLCFFVLSEIPTTISSTVASTTTPMLTSGADANTTTTTSATVVTDLVPTTMTSALPAQQQMLSMLAAFQKQQTSVSGQQTGIGALDLASTPVSTNVSQPMYSASGLDLASMLQSGAGSSNNRALVLAAALAASQSQKQQQFGPQCGAVGGGGGAAGAAAPTSALSLHQKQLAAAMAALQQQQQQQQHFQHPSGASGAYPSGSLQIQHLSATASDSTVEVPGGNLRYEEVSIQTIRACLNLDDLIAAAAASSRASAGGTLTSSGGNNPTQAAIALLQSNPRLRNLIEPAITRAINELTTPVFERCARITVTTVAAIVRKDFALDPDPNRMRYAAHQMVRHLAAGMSLITAREALGMSLVTGLKNIMLAEVQSASGQEKEAVQRLAHLVVAKTMHTCLAYMQKSVAEKAVNDVDKKLDSDIKLRTELGPRRFLEQASSQLAMQQANMPESLRLTVGGLTQSEMSVYEEFGRVIPGFAPSPAGSVSSSALGLGQPASPSTGGGGGSTTAAQVAVYLQQQKQAAELSSAGRIQRQLSTASSAAPGGVSLLKPLMGTTHSVGQPSTQQQLLLHHQQQQQQQQQTPMAGLWDKIIGQIERHLTFISSWLSSPNDPMIRSLRCLIDTMHLAKSNRDPAVAVTVIATMVKSFLEHYRPTAWCEQPRGLETMEHLKEAHMLTLRHMLSSDQASFGYAWVTRQVTQTWIQLDGGSVGKERQKPSSLAAGETAASGGSGPEQNSDAAAVVSTTAGNIATSKTEKSSTSETKGDGNDGFYGWNSTQSSALRFDGVDSRLHSIKWNWEAFAELLKVHVIYLSQVDSYLAQEVAAGHPGAITFVIDLLDHFVLPCPTGTAVGAAAAAAASYARSSVASTTGAGAGTGGPTGQAGSTGSTTGSAAVQYPAAGSAQSSLVPPKRGFTVLNEYDLWSTLEAMRTRVAHLNSALSARPSPASLLDPLGLRLRFACARVRGLLDLGLLEQSPLFLTSITPSPISALYAGCSQAREFDDPPNLQEKVELLMRNWVEIYQSPRQRDPATIEAMLAQLSQIGVLPNMDTLTRFLRLATIFVIERALKQLKLQEQHPQQPPQQQVPGMPPSVVPLSGGAGVSSNVSVARVVTYVELDAYARLISIIIKRSGEHHTEKPNIKITLLNKVLGIIVGILLQEHEVRRDWFHPMPFERILIMLFVELHSSYVLTGEVVEMPAETVTEAPPSGTAELGTDKANAAAKTPSRGLSNLGLQQQLPLVFCHLLHCLRPEKAAAFVFSWLEMLAHRWFVGRILAAPGPIELRAAYQAMYAQLLVDLLKFLGYFLQNALMPKPIQCLYKATLRLFLVLIHDFPEFVSDYYALFCDVVPSNSIQMRNLILSALPKRGIPSADPLQAPPVDNLASLDDPTGYCMEAGSRLPELMRRDIDAYHATRAPLKLLSELVTMLRRADDILPPPPPPPFVYHPQQQACHQQALAAYAAALVANDTGAAVPLPVTVSTAGKSDDKQASDEGGDQASGAQTSLGMPTTSASETNEGSSVSTDSTGQSGPRSTTNTSVGAVAAASPLLWGVRATQQLATFGMADGMHYNVELMTNLTLYVCITAIRNLREKGMPLNMSTIAHTPQMDIIQSLVLNLDNEGRYLLLNCMANQLRYPNSHTYYFSYTILYLFSEQSKEQVKEQISRVLMERLIVNRPHPWGLLMTSAELLRNPAYRFWEHEFARCNPEIEAIVTIVARSCIPNFQIPTMSSSNNSGQQQPSLRSNAAPSSAVATTDRRRQGSPLTHGSPSATDACPGAMRVSRALNSFVPG